MHAHRITGHVDERHNLSAQVPDTVPPGPVTITIVPAESNDQDDEWAVGVSQEWAEELTDVRQDIYTLDDGEPLDAA